MSKLNDALIWHQFKLRLNRDGSVLLEEKMSALKRACDVARERLHSRGCVGIVVVAPSGVLIDVPNKDGESFLQPMRYIAATSPRSLQIDAAPLSYDNPSLRASIEYQLRVFSVKDIGANSLAQHNVASVLGCAFSLVGSGFHAVAYFLFSAGEVTQSVLRDVSYETYGIWAGLRAALIDENQEIAGDALAINVLRLTQMGLTSQEVSERLGLKNARTVENKIDKMQKLLGAKSKLHTVQKAQIVFLI